jgi:Icc-related predicted phosphoesterase
MQIIAISDIYGDEEIVEELIDRIKSRSNERIVIVAGDIGLYDKREENDYLERVRRIFYMLLSVCKSVFYVPGDTDLKTLEIDDERIINLDRQYYIAEMGNMKIGLFGLGGAPKHSVRESFPYLWDERINVVHEDTLKTLKMNYEKLIANGTELTIMVTHSPPYRVADYSIPITLKEFVVLEEITEEQRAKTKSRNPRHLGSKAIKEFVNDLKPDVHIFGHVHKQGGKIAGKSVNVSHLSALPYKLTGRKFLRMDIAKEGVRYSFDSVVDGYIEFEEFIECYL